MSILLTGGTGKTSLRIARILSSADVPYIVASRSGKSPIRDGLPCTFDWNDESTWKNPWNLSPDVKAVWLVAPPSFEPVKVMKPFIEMARKRGCERFVLLSTTVAEEGGPLMGAVHAYLKGLGEAEGVEWCAMRPTWFMGMHIPFFLTFADFQR